MVQALCAQVTCKHHTIVSSKDSDTCKFYFLKSIPHHIQRVSCPEIWTSRLPRKGVVSYLYYNGVMAYLLSELSQ